MIFLRLAQAAAICAVSWFLWKYFRQIVIKSPLDNIPGPPPGSFLYGQSESDTACTSEADILAIYSVNTGNLRQILPKDGWGFIQHLTETYPGVARLTGPLGVRFLSICVMSPNSLDTAVLSAPYVVCVRPDGHAHDRREGSVCLRGNQMVHQVRMAGEYSRWSLHIEHSGSIF